MSIPITTTSYEAKAFAERELLTQALAPKARLLSRRIRAAIRRKPSTAAALRSLAPRLQRCRAADQPDYLSQWLWEYEACIDLDCRGSALFNGFKLVPLPDLAAAAQAAAEGQAHLATLPADYRAQLRGEWAA